MRLQNILRVLLCGQLLWTSSGMVAAQQAIPEPDSIQDIQYQGSPIFRLNFYDAHDDAPEITLNNSWATYKSTYTLNEELKKARPAL